LNWRDGVWCREQFEDIETFGSLLIGLQAQGRKRKIRKGIK